MGHEAYSRSAQVTRVCPTLAYVKPKLTLYSRLYSNEMQQWNLCRVLPKAKKLSQISI